jgi:hypothetical protein
MVVFILFVVIIKKIEYYNGIQPIGHLKKKNVCFGFANGFAETAIRSASCQILITEPLPLRDRLKDNKPYSEMFTFG